MSTTMASQSSPAQSSFTPGLKPPPGVVPDPNAPNPFRPWLIFTVSLCVGITGILLSMRCFVRAFIMRHWGLQDFLCIISWILFLGLTGLTVHGLNVGSGQHQWDLTPDQVKEVLFLDNANQIVYGVAIASIKVTLLYLYQCIFAPARYSRRWWAIMVVMVLNILFYTGLTFAKIFLCTPRAALWDKHVQAQCGSLLGVLIASSAWNTASDLIILAIPALFVWRLKLTREKRLALIAVFAIGAIAPFFSILGIAMREKYTTIPDATWGLQHVLMFAYAEVTAGHICASLPVMPRLYRWLRGKKQAGFLSNSQQYNKNTAGARHVTETAGSRKTKRYLQQSGIQGLQDKDLLATQTYVELTESETNDGRKHSIRQGGERGYAAEDIEAAAGQSGDDASPIHPTVTPFDFAGPGPR